MARGSIYKSKSCTVSTVCLHSDPWQSKFRTLTWVFTLGPVVRITPDEIHLSDPAACDKIYYVGSQYGKSALFYGAFGTDKATFTTPSPEVHRVKRAALSPFFSRKNVFALEDIVHQKADKLVARMRQAFATGGAIDLHHGFRAISVDVITDYAFDRCSNYLDEEKFGVAFFNMIRDFGPATWFFQQFPAVQPFALATPFWLAKLMSGPLTRMMMHQEVRSIVRVLHISGGCRLRLCFVEFAPSYFAGEGCGR